MNKLTKLSIPALTALAIPAIGAAASSTPAPLESLKDQGFEIEDQFQAPGDMTGYVAEYKGQPITIYLTPDKKRAIIGSMIDGEGNNLSSDPIQKMTAKKHEGIWSELEDSHWVADGDDDAERIVYEFTDANCPFCHKFWEGNRPWVDAGKVQVREVMVGVIKPDSTPKAAAILGADDPLKAMTENEEGYDDEGGAIEPPDNLSDEAKKKVEENNELMQSHGFYATPTIIYKDDDGNVQVKQGLPQGDEMQEVMGSEEP